MIKSPANYLPVFECIDITIKTLKNKEFSDGVTLNLLSTLPISLLPLKSFAYG